VEVMKNYKMLNKPFKFEIQRVDAVS